MRTKDKLRIIRSAINDQGIVELRGEAMLNASEYQTQNWGQVGRALSLLIEDGLIDGYQGTDVERFLGEMIETRPYSEEHRLEQNQYHTLESYTRDYTNQLPTVLRILERLHPDYFEDGSKPDSLEFAVELNIGSSGSITETQQKFDVVSDLFGIFLTLDRQVVIKGFDKGSDWVVFEALVGLETDFIIGVISCAKEVISAMAEKPSDAWRMMANLMLKNFKTDEDAEKDEESLVYQTWDRYIESIKDRVVDDMISNLKEEYSDHEELLNEGREKAKHAIDRVVALHSNGVTFQIPENTVHNNKIEIHGDNNVVLLPQINVMQLPSPSRSEVNEPERDDPEEPETD